MNGPAGIPEGGAGENPEGGAPGDGDALRAPAQAGEEEQEGHAAFDDAPGEPAIGAADGNVDPAMGAVDHHDADAGREVNEEATGGFPTRAEENANQILTDEGEIAGKAHAKKGHDADGAEEIAKIL